MSDQENDRRTVRDSSGEPSGEKREDARRRADKGSVCLTIPTTPDRIFRLLADGWMYANWVVGASRVRLVEAGWPAKGSKIHHSSGLWPLLVNDTTEVIAVEPNRLLELDARIWPVGAAWVQVRLEPDGATRTKACMAETFHSGPGRLIPEPAIAAVMTARNRECLRRLGMIAVNRETP